MYAIEKKAQTPSPTAKTAGSAECGRAPVATHGEPLVSPAPKRKILIISYLFPPLGGVAVQRALSLAKYLPESGFEVHVLRARNAAAPVRDAGLLKHIPASVRVHQAFTPELPFAFRQKLWRWFSRGGGGQKAASPAPAQTGRGWKSSVVAAVRRMLCPEPEVLWVPFALRKARRIVRRHGIDTVLVTAPPFSAFLVGNALKRENPQLSVISDFRDSWLDFYLKTWEYLQDEKTRRRAEQIERQTVASSDFVVTVTASIREELRSRYAAEPEGKFVLIPNGYDPEVFANFKHRSHGGPKIVVTHLGTVYSASSPRYFLDALESLPEQIREAFEMRFVGRIAADERPLLESRHCSVRMVDFMPQNEALRYLEETDYLLLVMTDPASLTGKLFEYLATGKPILAVATPGGEVDRVIAQTGAGWCVDPNDRAGLERMIRQAFERARGNTNGFTPNWAAIRCYERPRLAAQFGALVVNGRAERDYIEVTK